MGDRNVDEDTHQLLREEVLAGYPCWVVESVPKDKSYMYSKKIGWVRKDSLIATKVEYYDRRGTLIKTLTVPVQEKVNGFWTHAVRAKAPNDFLSSRTRLVGGAIWRCCPELGSYLLWWPIYLSPRFSLFT